MMSMTQSLSLFTLTGTRYQFKVFAENRHGVSMESQTVTAKMLDEGGFLDDHSQLSPFSCLAGGE